MIFVVNYASDRFVESQRIQNAGWAAQPENPPITVCSYTKDDIIPILGGLRLENESSVLRVLEQPRGDGLWAWKAILTWHVYRNLAVDGDIVFYMDSGACPVMPFGNIWERVRTNGHLFVRVSTVETVPAVREYLQSLPEMRAKASLLENFDFSSRLWTKPLPGVHGNESGLPPPVVQRLSECGAPIDELAVRLLDMEQVCGGFQGYLRHGTNDRILRDLLAITSLEFFDDVLRGGAPRPYIDHRHDQAMLSLIVNAESIRCAGFAKCIINDIAEVRLHRGWAPDYPDGF